MSGERERVFHMLSIPRHFHSRQSNGGKISGVQARRLVVILYLTKRIYVYRLIFSYAFFSQTDHFQ